MKSGDNHKPGCQAAGLVTTHQKGWKMWYRGKARSGGTRGGSGLPIFVSTHNPFRPLLPRALPAHVVGLARECSDAFPEESDRFPVLADALDDLGEGLAAEHCRRGGHVKGCHVLDRIAGRR
jgi:hypothetical protein